MALATAHERELSAVTVSGFEELVPCDLCGADDAETLYTRGRFRMALRNVICRRCGLVYINPRMPQARYDDFCLESYRKMYRKPTEPTASFRRLERVRGGAILHCVASRLPPRASVFEVGCRTGDVLDLFKKQAGCNVAGVEPDRTLATFAEHALGLAVRRGLFESVEVSPQSVDLMILCHVLEHAYLPTRWLEKIRGMLRAEGLVYIEVPNLRKPYGALDWYFQHAHPYSFTPKTLLLLARKTGFVVVQAGLDHPTLRVLLERNEAGLRAQGWAGDDAQDIRAALERHKRTYRLVGRWVQAWQRGEGWSRRLLRGWLERCLGSERTERLLAALRGQRNAVR